MKRVALKFKNLALVPPGGFRFYCHETGKWSRTEHMSLGSCVREATEFYRANHFPIPQDFARRIEQELCELLGPQWCVAANPKDDIIFPDMLSITTLQQGGKTLGHAIARKVSEGKWSLVEPDEVQRRAAICVDCHFNQSVNQITGCTSCNQGFVKGLLGSVSEHLSGCAKTPHDAKLFACRVCACPLRSKICTPKDIILEHMPERQQAMLPDFCWLKF